MSEEKQTVEGIASEIGWKEDFDVDGAKTAEEYILHSATINKKQSGTIRGQNDRLEELKNSNNKITSMMAGMQEKFNTVTEQQRVKHESDLDAQKESLILSRDKAIDEADRDEVNSIDKKIASVDKQKQANVAPSKEKANPDQEYFDKWAADKLEWLVEGSREHKEMLKSINNYRIDSNGKVDVVEELKLAEDRLKKKFPARFGLDPEELPPGGDVGEGKASKTKATKELDIKSLDATERQEYKEYERIMGKNFNSKAMLKNFANMRAARS